MFHLTVDNGGQYIATTLLELAAGNPSVQKSKKSIIHVQCVYDILTTLLDQLLPAVAKKENFFLVSISEETILQVAVLREKYRLKLGPPPEFAKLFISKAEMKIFWNENDITCADYALFDVKALHNKSEAELHEFCKQNFSSFPIFVKPIAGSGSFESCQLLDFAQFCSWVKRSTKFRFHQFLAEEKLVGSQYSYCAFVHSRNLIGVACSASGPSGTMADIVHFSRPFAENYIRKGIPLFEELHEFGSAILRKTGAIDFPGVYIMEMMRKQSGELAVVEMGARPFAGMGCNQAILRTTGYDPESYAIAAPFMQNMELVTACKFRNYASVTLPSRKTGKVKYYNDIDEALICPGAAIDRIAYCYKEKEDISNQLSYICDAAMTIGVGGDDEKAVEQTAEAIRKFHDPVEVE